MIDLSVRAANNGPTATIAAQCEPQVELDNLSIWSEFHAVRNEMIVTKAGRRMFPVIELRISGLEPQGMYSIAIEFRNAAQTRFKFVNGEWVASGKADSSSAAPYYLHPESPHFGQHWMKDVINFSKIKLSNKSVRDGVVTLNSLHLYQPVVHVFQIRDGQHDQLLKSVQWKETQFIAVTAYQNDEVTSLKIKHNPFAKAFQDVKERYNNLQQQQQQHQSSIPKHRTAAAAGVVSLLGAPSAAMATPWPAYAAALRSCSMVGPTAPTSMQQQYPAQMAATAAYEQTHFSDLHKWPSSYYGGDYKQLQNELQAEQDYKSSLQVTCPTNNAVSPYSLGSFDVATQPFSFGRYPIRTSPLSAGSTPESSQRYPFNFFPWPSTSSATGVNGVSPPKKHAYSFEANGSSELFHQNGITQQPSVTTTSASSQQQQQFSPNHASAIAAAQRKVPVIKNDLLPTYDESTRDELTRGSINGHNFNGHPVSSADSDSNGDSPPAKCSASPSIAMPSILRNAELPCGFAPIEHGLYGSES